MKVLVIGNENYGKWIDGYEVAGSIEEADIVVFTGGEDVQSELYGEKPHHLTYSNPRRDKVEIELFNKAKDLGKLIVSICRGSQFMTVMAGGKLVQHVNNHAIGGTHEIITVNGQKMQVTSTHHQMMYPFNMKDEDYEILAFASPRLSDVYFKNNVMVYGNIEYEPEVVWYNKIKALAIQLHPEYMDKDSDVVLWLNKLIKYYNEL